MPFTRWPRVVIHSSFWWVAFLLAFVIEPQAFARGFLPGVFLCFMWVGIILSSLLVHEYGHAFTASYFGQKTRIELAGFWGLTYRKGPKLSLIKEFFVVFNGPLMTFFLYLFFDGMQGFFSDEKAFYPYLVLGFRNLNLFWLLTNLLPIYPLDGGQLMKIIFTPIFAEKALKYASILSLIFGMAIGLLAFVFGYMMMGCIFMILSFEALQTFRLSKDLVREDDQESYQLRLEKAITLYKENDKTLAKENFTKLRKELKKGKIYALASFFLAKIYDEEEKTVEALEVLTSVEMYLDYQGLKLYQKVLFESENYQKSLYIGKKAFRLSPGSELAKVNAQCAGYLKQAKEAVGWLRFLAGFSDIPLQSILKHPSLDSIREEPVFLRFLQQQFSDKKNT